MALADIYTVYSTEEMKNLKTRQLLAHLRSTYVWGPDDYESWWPDTLVEEKSAYQAAIKAELATREHIPNKKESKAMRVARIKKGK